MTRSRGSVGSNLAKREAAKARRNNPDGVFLSSDTGPKAGFIVDDKAVEKLLVTPEAKDHLFEVLRAAQFQVRELAPKKGQKYATGGFRTSISVTVRTVLDGKVANGYSRDTAAAGQKRLVGFLYSYDPKWHLLEYGGYHNKPLAVFTRGMERAGLQYVRTSKGGV